VPVGATPERKKASRDLPIAREVEQRGFLVKFATQRTILRITGEFGLSTGRFSQNRPSARAGFLHGPPCARAGRALLGRGSEGWATRSV
jgi:hypothetical protein